MKEIKKQQKIEVFLTALGVAITETLKKELSEGIGFALILFEFNNPGIGNYVSNAERPDMIKALRETADRLEKNQDIPPAHKTEQ